MFILYFNSIYIYPLLFTYLDAFKKADGRKIDDRRIVVDFERGRTLKDFKPRRLGKFSFILFHIILFFFFSINIIFFLIN